MDFAWYVEKIHYLGWVMIKTSIEKALNIFTETSIWSLFGPVYGVRTWVRPYVKVLKGISLIQQTLSTGDELVALSAFCWGVSLSSRDAI